MKRGLLPGAPVVAMLVGLAVVLPACKSTGVSTLDTTPTPTPAPATAPTASARAASAPGDGGPTADFIQVPFGNSGGTPATHLPDQVNSFVVRKTDNAIITGSGWDEGGVETSIIKDGATVGSCGHLHAWGAFGQGHVAVNSRHIYAAVMIRGEDAMQRRSDIVAPVVGNAWWGFHVYNPDGSESGGAFPVYKYFVKLSETVIAPKGQPSTDTPITGMAASESDIYVAIGSLDKVFKVDAATLKVGSFHVPAPGRMVIDAGGHLWVVSNTSKGRDVLQLAPDGRPTGKVISGAKPDALGLTKTDDLLVSSGLNVLRYRIAGKPTLEQTWSAVIAGYDGTPGPFRWRGTVTGATSDGDGNIVVVWVDGQHTVYECYSPAGALLWQKVSLLFDEAASPILNDDKTSVDVYTSDDVFTIRLDRSPPTWAWKGHVRDGIANPTDPANGTMMVQKVGDRRLVLKASHYSAAPVTLLTPSVGTLLQPRVTYRSDPGTNDWYWHLQPNGDLIEVTDRKGLHYFTFKGYDASGVPLHERSGAIVPPDPIGDRWGGADGDAFDRAIYDLPSDTLLVAGHTDKKPRAGSWGEFRVLVAYGGFGAYLKDPGSGHLVERWRIDLPYPGDPGPSFAKSPGHPRGLWVLGGTCMVQFMQTEAIAAYDLATGSYLGQYSPNVGSWLDINAGFQGVLLPNGKMFLTILSLTQESAMGLLGSFGAPLH